MGKSMENVVALTTNLLNEFDELCESDDEVYNEQHKDCDDQMYYQWLKMVQKVGMVEALNVKLEKKINVN